MMGHLLIHLVESNWIPSDLMLGGFSVENVNDNSMANQSVGVVYDVQISVVQQIVCKLRSGGGASSSFPSGDGA